MRQNGWALAVDVWQIYADHLRQYIDGLSDIMQPEKRVPLYAKKYPLLLLTISRPREIRGGICYQ